MVLEGNRRIWLKLEIRRVEYWRVSISHRVLYVLQFTGTESIILPSTTKQTFGFIFTSVRRSRLNETHPWLQGRVHGGVIGRRDINNSNSKNLTTTNTQTSDQKEQLHWSTPQTPKFIVEGQN